MENTNPLSQYFRQPAIYLRLPSGGRFWPAGTLDMPQNGELPVYPMTAMDEIAFKTPDALFNGEAIVGVVQSCMPNIKNAWAIPSMDLDTILISIRIASYGKSMPIGTKCPKCEEENEFSLDLNSVLDGMKPADFSEPLTIGDLEVWFRPLNYHEATQNGLIQFEQQKTMQMLGNSEIPEEEKIKNLNQMMRRISELTMESIVHSIGEIRIADGNSVTDPNYISEWLKNSNSQVYNAVRDRAIDIKETSEIKPLNISCPDCKESYEQAFTLDMSRFFGGAS